MLLRTILKSARTGKMRNLVFTLSAALFIIGALPNPGDAALIPADEASPAQLRQENLAKIKATLEKKEIAARLADYGLTPEEVTQRLSSLSDEQISELAANLDRLNAGGDALGTLIAVALLVLLVLLILHLLGYIDLRLPKPKYKEKKQPQ